MGGVYAFFAQHGLDQLLVLVVVLAFDGLQVIGPLVGGLSDLPDLDGVSEAFKGTVEFSLNQLAQDLLRAEEPFVGSSDLALQGTGLHVFGQEDDEVSVQLAK